MINQEQLDQLKEYVVGPKPQRTAKYAGGVKKWGWSSEIIYKWRNSSYDHIDRQLVSSYR